MRRRANSSYARYSVFVVSLLVLSGAGGYFGSQYFFEETGVKIAREDTDISKVTEEPAPDTEACLATISSSTKLAQKLMFAVYNDQAEAIAPIVASLGIGGVIIMDETSSERIKQLRDSFAITPLVAVDQEGGTVQRYKSHGILPGAGSIPTLAADEIYMAYLEDSTYLASMGITTNFAPVVDVESRIPSPLPGRMYSNDPETVTLYAKKAVEAMQTSNIQPVIKHFPGMGSASGNTDFTSATTDEFTTLSGRDLIPYKELAQMDPDVMVGNMIVPGLTNGQPAIWSPQAITLLRDAGYQDAVVYSDSLTAEAVPGTIEEATLKAWQAGVDIVVIVQQREDVATITDSVTSILASGRLQLDQDKNSELDLNKSVKRIFDRKGVDPCTIS